MKASAIGNLDNASLVDLFISLSEEQDDAELRNETARWNRLYKRLELVSSEMALRSGDARRLLVPHFRHKNPQVRINAVIAALATEPSLAREALEWIATWDVGPQKAQALGMISALDSGSFVPR